MRQKSVLLRWTIVVCVLVLFPLTTTFGQQPPPKKPLAYDAYDGWKSIQSPLVSRDGTWLAYVLSPQEGDGELVVRNLKTGKEFRQARGQAPVITVDGMFVVFTIAPPKADVDKAKKDKKKPEEQPKNSLGVLNLTTGDVTTAERVKSFKVPEESSAYVAYLLEPPVQKEPEKKDEAKKEPEKKEPEKKEPAQKPAEKKEAPAKKPKEKKKEPGTDLVLRELATGQLTTIAEVVEYAWNKPGTWLACATSSKKPEDDGVYAMIVKSPEKTKIALMRGLGHYKSLTFDDKGTQLAFLSDRDDYKADVSPCRLYYWAEGTSVSVEAASGTTKGMPSGTAVSENGKLNFSKDGTKLFFGYAPPPQPEPDEDATPPVKVDIWNWKDADLQPMQKVNADQDKKKSYMAVIHFLPKERTLIPLATPSMPTVTFSEDSKVALGSSSLAYRQLVSWDQSYSDFYLVNMTDGSRKKILEKFGANVGISPGGQYLLYYNEPDRNWYSYRLLDGKTFNLTAKLGVGFFQDEWDTPSDPAAYGLAGWTDGDASVLIYDKYDIWEVKPDGTSGRLATNGLGRKNGLVFRYVRLDPEERTVSRKEPILLATTDDATKATGYYRLSLAPAGPESAKLGAAEKKPAPAAKAPIAGGEAASDPVKVIMMNKLMGGLRKAKNADVFLFTIQTTAEFPNLWTSGPTFWDMRKVSDANPQQAEYIWGRSELIQYMNADGRTLDAVLIRPEDFDPAKKYPLMVNIYERLADGLNRYTTPSPGTSINIARYVSNGYVVLQPDIVYETGYPGSSALKCVIPAVARVVAMGFIDPKRVGIQGHSWGGYEITYMITQTDIFAAVEAGASVSNMTSAYGGIRWGTGMVREFQYEKTQSRIGATLFDRALQFIENSPIFWIARVKTPYLTIHNDEDDAVPWYQGIEFFTAMRRLGKEAYMFTFNGEKHGLRERDNMKYWTVHLDEFFDHYLLGKPLPEWMDKGVPYLERGKRDVASLFKKKDEKK